MLEYINLFPLHEGLGELHCLVTTRIPLQVLLHGPGSHELHSPSTTEQLQLQYILKYNATLNQILGDYTLAVLYFCLEVSICKINFLCLAVYI